uniref:Uncharacterized protein n=1 Tax=Arundo donax TaxID=35708 RepID=A0A0A8ZK98_ARUDO
MHPREQLPAWDGPDRYVIRGSSMVL